MTQTISDMTWNELHTYVGTLVGDLKAKDETINQLTTGLRLPGYIGVYERTAGDRYVLIPLTKADLSEMILPTDTRPSLIGDIEDSSGKLINVSALNDANREKLISHCLEAIKRRLECETTYSLIHSDAQDTGGESGFIQEVVIEAVKEWFDQNDITVTKRVKVQVLMTIDVEVEHSSFLDDEDVESLIETEAEQVIYRAAPSLEFTDFSVDTDTIEEKKEWE